MQVSQALLASQEHLEVRTVIALMLPGNADVPVWDWEQQGSGVSLMGLSAFWLSIHISAQLCFQCTN